MNIFLNIFMHFLILSSFFCGDQTIPCKGGNKAEAQNHVEANTVNSKQVSKLQVQS